MMRAAGITETDYALEDVYRRDGGRVFLSGVQALVRLPIMQRRLDRRRGLSTAGLISGYRGSPLASYDQQLWKAAKFLESEDIVFQPGLNEDLAATALWGAQMHAAFGEVRVAGVFGIWYGKGPGVDRCGDVFRNANIVGAAKLGGVIAVAGDDHGAQSSMFPHQTDGIFHSVSMPVLQPASVAEILSLGLAGFALSRYSGLWVGMKTIAEVVESAESIDLPEPHPTFLAPQDIAVPAHGFNWDPGISWPAQRAELERRLIEERLPAALAWCRANQLDRVTFAAPDPRFGIVTVGKAHQDLLQALDDLDLEPADLARLGISIYKIALSWPLETVGVQRFASGLREVLVVEEKRGLVETQIKAALYGLPDQRRPAISGKTDPAGRPLLPETLELTPLKVARALLERLGTNPEQTALREHLQRRVRHRETHGTFPRRQPYFCAGCPHNVSTQTPEGSVAGGGIGCHAMALSLPERRTVSFTQMGGEGVQWVGASRFSATPHMFQNLGDGTYQHSGLLAIRAAVATNTNITFRILYNDAVAMTGGQPIEGALDPLAIVRQLAAEGVRRIALVSDDPGKWQGNPQLAPLASVLHRDELDLVQRDMRAVPGVTAIVYDQTCAAEARRRRKKSGVQARRALFINARVCEGCGDCAVQSSCIAVEPVETPFGRKRRINQQACNADMSCAKGLCPSFVEVESPTAHRAMPERIAELEAPWLASLPTPSPCEQAGASYNIYVAGIGGAGVLTLGALLGMAAHLEGKRSSVLDFTGLAQKNGGVVSQVRIGESATPAGAVRIGDGSADVLLASDVVVASAPETLAKLGEARTACVVNTNEAPTIDMLRNGDVVLPMDDMLQAIRDASNPERHFTLRATALAQALFGDALVTNTLLLGFAWQRGLIPLGMESIERAIELNGVAVSVNRRAFAWGRIAACDLPAVERLLGITEGSPVPLTLDAFVRQRLAELERYQSAAYARQYRDVVELARRAGDAAGDRETRFARAVATHAFTLMAFKDEYEVARLYSEPEFMKSLTAQFSGWKRLHVWLAPPLFARVDAATGRTRKRRFGPWVFRAFGVLARLKGLRGTPFDPFGYTHERRAERRVRDKYIATIEQVCAALSEGSLAAAVDFAESAAGVRGYGIVKRAGLEALEARLDAAMTLGYDDARMEGMRARKIVA